ncbi:hypothetical protein GCM10007919_40590 [Rhizobium indigoferae]|nr:hypothetical protein GCM10007919_40590 [Rhizobium indigoferae]
MHISKRASLRAALAGTPALRTLPAPQRLSAAEAFLSHARAIVLVRDLQPGIHPPDPELVRDVLGLTLGEARLASLVGTGIAIGDAAGNLNITEQTARVVLKRVFSKLEVSRQSELAAFMGRLMLF